MEGYVEARTRPMTYNMVAQVARLRSLRHAGGWTADSWQLPTTQMVGYRASE